MVVHQLVEIRPAAYARGDVTVSWDLWLGRAWWLQLGDKNPHRLCCVSELE